jgi:HK97 family phage major capsid protein
MGNDTDNALKAISSTPEELRIGNYIVVFGGRDATGYALYKNNDGSRGEFFTPKTELESDYTKTGFLHVDFEHGQDPDDLNIGSDDVLGFVDWKTAKIDERGVFVERVLNRRQKYVEWLKPLIEEGLIGNSSEAVSGRVERGEDGEIKSWPLKRDTLTVNPLESRMLSENAMTAIKALAKEEIPCFKSLITTLPVDTGGKEQLIVNESEVKMTDEELKAQKERDEGIAKSAAEAAVKAYAESLIEVKAGYQVDVIEDEADKAAKLNPFKTAGEFFSAVKRAGTGGETDKRLLAMKAAAGANETVPSEGGFLVQQDIASNILEKTWSVGSVLSRFNAIPVQGNGMKFNVVDETSRADGSRQGGILGYWLAEAAEKTATKTKFRQLSLDLKKVAALCYATDELLEDATALETWITTNVPNELRFQVEAAIMNGNGVGKPLGIIASPAFYAIERQTAGAFIDAIDLGNMWAHRYTGANDYVWFVSSTIFPQLMNLTVGQVPAYMPPGGLSGAPYGTIFGRPVIETEYNPSLGTAGDIVLAAPSQYALITKGGVKAASSIHVKFVSDETAFRFVFRVDGEPTWNAKVSSYYASSDYVSPFVGLLATS